MTPRRARSKFRRGGTPAQGARQVLAARRRLGTAAVRRLLHHGPTTQRKFRCAPCSAAASSIRAIRTRAKQARDESRWSGPRRADVPDSSTLVLIHSRHLDEQSHRAQESPLSFTGATSSLLPQAARDTKGAQHRTEFLHRGASPRLQPRRRTTSFAPAPGLGRAPSGMAQAKAPRWTSTGKSATC